MTSSYLVGVAGGSCSGKSHFCAQLKTSLSQRAVSCEVISLDNFYLDRSAIPAAERWQLNFDHPDALDWPLLSQFLSRLGQGAGEALELPRYDFASHTRSKDCDPVPPAQVYLVEGLYALLDKTLLPYQLTVFIDCHESLTLYRRLSRDAKSRGRSEEQTLTQYYDYVLPMYRQHISPTRHNAHFTIEWLKTEPTVLSHLTDMIVSRIDSEN